MSLVGARPRIIRLPHIFIKLGERCGHMSVHTGQNYDYLLNQVSFDD